MIIDLENLNNDSINFQTPKSKENEKKLSSNKKKTSKKNNEIIDSNKTKKIDEENKKNKKSKIKNISNYSESEIEISSKKQRKPRRSKEIMIGRTFICPFCNKGYLSRPALHNHKKNKHSPNEFKELPISCLDSKNFTMPLKKRGRPNKNSVSKMENIKDFFNKKNKKNDKFDFNNNNNYFKDGFVIDNKKDPYENFLNFVKNIINQKYFDFVEKYIKYLKFFINQNNNNIKYEKIPTFINEYFKYIKKQNYLNDEESK